MPAGGSSPQWAKVLDQSRCIGCDACTAACRSENQVPIGVTRTWVKAVEVGAYPQPRRHLQVMRCNHCEDAPCVSICPTGAMYRRPDGIVDVDRDACLGCRACMVACPYDAIAVDPMKHTADKCTFCAHRIDVGLEPACVAACPVDAILVGNLADPTSRVAEVVQRQPVTVRRPEQGTRPRVFYRGATQATLDPLGLATGSPTSVAQVLVGNAGKQPRAWGGRSTAGVWAFLLATGVGPAATVATAGAGVWGQRLWTMVPALMALGLLILGAAGTVLSVGRPGRLPLLLLRPQWRSWLARAAALLCLYGLAMAVAAVLAAIGPPIVASWVLGGGAILGVVAALALPCVLSQAVGRDLWQSPVLSVRSVAGSLASGAGLVLVPATLLLPRGVWPLAIVVGAAGAVHLVLVLAEVLVPHPTAHGRVAIRELTRGRGAVLFWFGNAGVALALLSPLLPPLAALAPLGLLGHQHAYLEAGQSVPLT
jgi:Fe-S-cluster-containing dehydrogenase component